MASMHSDRVGSSREATSGDKLVIPFILSKSLNSKDTVHLRALSWEILTDVEKVVLDAPSPYTVSSAGAFSDVLLLK